MAESNTQNSLKKQARRFLLSFANLSRSLFVSLFGLLINYILVRYKSSLVLETYVLAITCLNVLMVFSNWGAKDYLVKLMSSPGSDLRNLLGRFFGGKALLCLFLTLVVLLLPFGWVMKLFCIAYLILRSFVAAVEPLVILKKKFQAVLLVDLFVSVSLMIVVFVDGNQLNPTLFLMELLLAELTRCLALYFIFRNHLNVRLQWAGGITLLKESRFFFFTAVAGFLCSRADQYVVAIFLPRAELSTYYILMNLVILCQTGYTTFINTFSANIFRYKEQSFNRFLAYTTWLGVGLSLVSCSAIYVFCTVYYHIAVSTSWNLLIFLNVFAFSLVLLQVYHYTRLELQKEIFKVIALAGSINILCSVILVPRWGLTGALVSNTLCALCTFGLFKLYSYYREKA